MLMYFDKQIIFIDQRVNFNDEDTKNIDKKQYCLKLFFLNWGVVSSYNKFKRRMIIFFYMKGILV